MERADLEKLGIEGWKALPKGERMFLAERDKATGKGEEILILARRAGIRASQAHDLIMLHGYNGALALVERTQGDLLQVNITSDTTQALLGLADAASRTNGHTKHVEALLATSRGKDERCTSYTRAVLYEELDENPEKVDVQCYLNEGHRDEWHCGWHPILGSLRWHVPPGTNEA